METAKKLEMLKEIDEIFEAKLHEDEKVKVQDVLKENMDELSQKYGIDPVDLFITYMDHVAIDSKKLGRSNGDEIQMEIDMNNIDGIKF